MSEAPFPPPHDHDHGAGHPPPPAVTPPVGLDDASSQALSVALQSSFRIVKLLMVVLVLVFLGSGVFVVQPNQVAVLLRFGRPVGVGSEQLLKPGWHWGWPRPIDEVMTIAVGQSYTVTSTTGWHATSPDMEALKQEPQARGSLSPETDGYVLTADGNIVHARATIKYRIADPLRYSFGFTNTTELLTNIVNNALIHAAAHTTAEAMIYKEKTGYRDAVVERVRQKIEELNLGVVLEPSEVETKAPVDVRPAFEAVNATEQDRDKAIRTAEGDRDEIVRRADGEAQAIINQSIASSNSLVSRVEADARYFNDVLPYYRQDPHLFEQRLLTATLQIVMTNAQDKFYQPERIGEIRLQMSREPLGKVTAPAAIIATPAAR
jgi:membrane protease subunit HflK